MCFIIILLVVVVVGAEVVAEMVVVVVCSMLSLVLCGFPPDASETYCTQQVSWQP